MNPIFSAEGLGWRGFPRRSYGRLDQVEPIDLSQADEAVFAFDVVDADWIMFNNGAAFDLDDPIRIHQTLTKYWLAMFKQKGSGPAEDLYAGAPIFLIEVTVKRDDPWFAELATLKESDWISIELDATGDHQVDVFGGLFMAPVQAYLMGVDKVSPAQQKALGVAFDMDTWPDATQAEMEAALGSNWSADYLVAYDVGQGSANALLDGNEDAWLYFDLGRGVYRNYKTTPTPLRFCWRVDAPIVLSHWDSDHWAGETTDPAATARVWIAPRQQIGPRHTAFASRILAAGGTIHIWGSSPSRLSISLASGRQLDLARCSGNTRNGSGISCLVHNITLTQAWLLTGDAAYDEVNQLAAPTNYTAVVVPHHGADMGSWNQLPTPKSSYTRLVYSFGPDNKHGRSKVRHPTRASVHNHKRGGWNHNAWAPASPATITAGGDVLATATHSSTHLGGTVVGWLSAPAVPFRTVPCAGSPPGGSGCTGTLDQS